MSTYIFCSIVRQTITSICKVFRIKDREYHIDFPHSLKSSSKYYENIIIWLLQRIYVKSENMWSKKLLLRTMYILNIGDMKRNQYSNKFIFF